MIKIGIPTTLGAAPFYKFWEVFFRTLGFDVLTAQQTGKQLLADASRLSDPELCLPAKLYIAQCNYLAGNGVDAIFSPYYESTDLMTKPCPKIIMINELVKAAVKKTPPMIQPCIELDIDDEMFSFASLLKDRIFGRQIAVNNAKSKNAYDKAMESFSLNRKTLKEGVSSGTIALLGHTYVLNNEFLMKTIYSALKKQGLRYITSDEVPWKECKEDYCSANMLQALHWQAGKKIVGFTKRLSGVREIIGAVYISAFGCGLDEVIHEGVIPVIRKKGIPYLFIMMDEHTQPSNTGVRMEAFLEICKKKT